MALPRTLRDDILELRPPTTDDIDEIFAGVRESLPEILPWMAWAHPDYARVDTAEWVRSTEQAWTNETEHPFAIVERATGCVLGTCGLNGIDRANRWANLGYWVRTPATRRGVASRATTLVADFGFHEIGLDRIEILAAAGNTPSQRVATRVGATREGVARRRLRVRETTHDAVVFSLIRDVWR
jgi:RimJ/RimL family protein N-acetyltransferase